jgi:hypothetical protein
MRLRKMLVRKFMVKYTVAAERRYHEIHCGCGEEIPKDHTLHVFHLFYAIKEHNLDIRLL